MSQAKEHPILFSGPMVRAILEGLKTQTRRVIPFPSTGAFVMMETKDGGWWPYKSMDGESTDDGTGNETPMNCRYGGPGDRLWVKETWTHTGTGVWRVSDVHLATDGKVLYAATDKQPCSGCWFPSIHMFRWASRITLDFLELRVQRIQDISEEDAQAEGVIPNSMTEQDIADLQISDCNPEYKELARLLGPGRFSHKFTYQMLWDELNAKRGFGWDRNPWVWAITFRQVTA